MFSFFGTSSTDRYKPDMDELTTLQAKRRPPHEPHTQRLKQQRFEDARDAYVYAVAIKNFVSGVLQHKGAARSEVSVKREHEAVSDRLEQTLTQCEATEDEIRKQANLLSQLLAEYSSKRQANAEKENQLDTLRAVLVESSDVTIEQQLQAAKSELDSLTEQQTRLQTSLDEERALLASRLERIEQLESIKSKRYLQRQIELKAPEREQLEVLQSFLKTKTQVHETLSGHTVVSGTHPVLKLSIPQHPSVCILLKFDDEYHLIHASSTGSALSGSTREGQLAEKAVLDDNAFLFVSSLKLLLHQNSLFAHDLATLKQDAQSQFLLQYKPERLEVVASFEACSATLKIPFEYSVMPIQLEKIESHFSRQKFEAARTRITERCHASACEGRSLATWIKELKAEFLKG